MLYVVLLFSSWLVEPAAGSQLLLLNITVETFCACICKYFLGQVIFTFFALRHVIKYLEKKVIFNYKC